MNAKEIFKTLFISMLFLTSDLAAETNEDTLSSKTEWHYESASRIANDGKWVILHQFFAGEKAKARHAFFVNTSTQKKVQIPNFTEFHNALMNNGIVAGRIDGKFAIVRLDNPSNITYLDSIKSFKAVKNSNLLVLLTHNNQLRLLKPNNGSSNFKEVFRSEHVTEFILNNRQDKLIYQTKGLRKELHYLELSALKSKKLINLKEDLKPVIWSAFEDAFVIVNSDNSLTLINLSDNETKTINLEKEKLERLKVEFFKNNDLYISYNILSDQTKEPHSGYVDIWNGNSRFLIPSDFKIKKDISYKAFVYTYQTNDMIELERSIDKEYLNIGVPGYLLQYNQFEFQDFQMRIPNIRYSLFDIASRTVTEELTTTPLYYFFLPSADGKHLLYPAKTIEDWEIYNFETKERQTLSSNGEATFVPIWCNDNEHIFLIQGNNLVKYNVKSKQNQTLSNFKDEGKMYLINSSTGIHNNKAHYIDKNHPFLFAKISPGNNSINIYKNKKVTKLATSTNVIANPKNLKDTSTPDGKTLVFTEENFNMPPTLKLYTKGKTTTLYKNSMPEEFYNWRKMKTFEFEDKYGVKLKGFLQYPKNFTPDKKYPMIIWIYESFMKTPYLFSMPSLESSEGFNEALFTENGYFACFLDTYVSDEGPGISATDCVLKGTAAAIRTEPSINADKIGLVGFSFSGYKVSAIATQTDRFAAIVSGGGAHDLIGGFSFRYNYYRQTPDWFMTENSQYMFKDTYADNPKKYINNSPLLNAHKVKTPMLLWTGLEDDNVDWENTRKMFVALKRYKKPVIALFYNNVGHSMSASDSSQLKDLNIRSLQWFDYFLKDKRDTDWINKGINYNKYTWNRLETM